MGMASGESDMYFGTDVATWGAEGAGIFVLAYRRGGIFFYPFAYTQNARIFVGKSNTGEQHNKISTP
jgi:hypothetical protein